MINFFVSHYTSLIKSTIENKFFYNDIEKIEDITTKALLRKTSTQASAAIPIYDRGSSKFGTPNGNLIGILVVDWVFSDVPKEFIKSKEENGCCFTDEFKEHLLLNGESVANLIKQNQ